MKSQVCPACGAKMLNIVAAEGFFRARYVLLRCAKCDHEATTKETP